MTKTRDLSDLLDANGDVKSTALDNVPASNDASALTTGTLDSARLGTITNFTSTGIDDNATSTAITIDSSQNVLVGTTASTDPATNNVVGIRLADTGRVSASATSTQALNLNRTTDDGDIAIFRKDGSSVGSIGTKSTELTIGNASTGLLFDDDAGYILPWNLSTNAGGNNTIDLGNTNQRFKDLYIGNDIAHLDAAGNARLLYDKSANLLGNAGSNLQGVNVTVSGNIYLGGTGSANALDDYEEGTWTPTIQASGTAFSSIGFSQQIGYYTKIGRMVIAQGIVAVNSLTLGSASGNIRIGSLPFTASNTSLPYGSAMDYANNIDFNGGGFGTINIGLQVVQNSTTASPTRTRNLNGADGVPVPYLRSNSSMNFCCIYNTDS